MIFGWSQERCDLQAGVNPGRTYSYERGRAAPPPEFMEPLAAVWGIPIEWFYDGKDTMPPSGIPSDWRQELERLTANVRAALRELEEFLEQPPSN